MAKKISKISVSIEEPKTLIGIACNENDHRVSWDVNNRLKIQLTREDNLLHIDSKKQPNNLIFYSYSDDENNQRYFLISNKGTNGFLADNYKNIDYFLILCGSMTAKRIDVIVSSIKQSQMINATFVLPATTLKSLVLPC